MPKKTNPNEKKPQKPWYFALFLLEKQTTFVQFQNAYFSTKFLKLFFKITVIKK